MQYLLLSNSTMPGQPYFEWPKPHVKSFLGTKRLSLVFIPYAGVTFSYDSYIQEVKNAFNSMGYEIVGIHSAESKQKLIEESQGIVVGGGNTFHLLYQLYKENLITPLREKVISGTPFIGWSAGSNIAGPTIMTTNDMPIIQPPTFDALNLCPLQINPHFTEKTIEGHGGESRSQRINEFLEVNKTSKVIGLPEGMFIQRKDDETVLGGVGTAKYFAWNEKPVDLQTGEQINRFL